MNPISRRKFLATSALSIAATRLRAQGPAQIQANLAIPSDAAGPHVPADFIGLSYEAKELSNPDFFSAKNTGLIRAFKQFLARRLATWRQHQRIGLVEANSRLSRARASAHSRSGWRA